jgi:cytochrome c-type biogenesis protein CcmH/NrfG
MGWVFAIGLAVIAATAMIVLGRLPRSSWELLGSALLLGIAGYAWQGRPALSGAPRNADMLGTPFDEKLVERRLSLSRQYGKAAQWLTLSDGMARQGKPREAANVLLSGLRDAPDDPALWLGLGNALVAQGDNIISPAADYAYRRAMALAPQSPGAPYFYGLALARSGQLDAARGMWAPLAARLPANSDLRGELERDIVVIDRVLAQGAPAAP